MKLTITTVHCGYNRHFGGILWSEIFFFFIIMAIAGKKLHLSFHFKVVEIM